MIDRQAVRACVCAAVVWLGAAPALAQAQQLELKPDEEALVDLSGDPQDADDTAVRIKNLSGQTGIVDVAFDPQAGPGPQDTVADGFALVDGTLIVSSDLPPGELRVRYRIEAGTRALGRAGIRIGQQRLMRRDANLRWRPAIRALRAGTRARYLRDTRADFELGHHGFSLADEYVWAVIDVNSHYAAGGAKAQAALPGLVPAGWIVLGLALLAAAAWSGSLRRA